MLKKRPLGLFASCLALVFLLLRSPVVRAADRIQEGEMAGYLLVPHGKVPETYNAGFSMYVAAWPLLREYPGHRFQTGLFGTWMFASACRPQTRQFVFRYRGGPGLVAGHAVCHRNAEVHHGWSGSEFQRMGQWPGRRQGEGLETIPRASTAWHSSVPGYCGPPMD